MKTRLILLTTLLAVATAVVGQKRYLDNIKKAEAGDAEAQFEVGKAYDLGEGVEKDLAQAAVWYKKSASQGNMKAQNNLGDYLTREVRRESFDENSKLQTPTVIPSQALAGSWQQMKLK